MSLFVSLTSTNVKQSFIIQSVRLGELFPDEPANLTTGTPSIRSWNHSLLPPFTPPSLQWFWTRLGVHKRYLFGDRRVEGVG